MITLVKLEDAFDKYNLQKGRIISFVKEDYQNEHPFNTVFFNANIFIKKSGIFLKVWFGDLDISLEGEVLKRISKEAGVKLYVLREEDGRRSKTKNQNVIEDCAWHTDMDTPYISHDEQKRLIEESQVRQAENLSNKIVEYSLEKQNSSKLPVIDIDSLFDTKVIKKIVIDPEDIDLFFDKAVSITAANRVESDEVEFMEDLFANLFFDQILKEELGIENSTIRVSSFWIGEEFNNIMNIYNKKFDSKFMSEEQIANLYPDGQYFQYSSYFSTFQYSNSNELGFSNSSLTNFTIYVLEDYNK